MIEFVSQNHHKDLILFVHGFTGDTSTWLNKQHGSFPELLLEEDKISSQFDVAHFSYYTKLLNLFSKTSNFFNITKMLFGTSHGKLKKNISIDEIANLLRTEIRFKLQNYDNIIIIAHSMGGLVAKSCIVQDIQENLPSKIKLFISLAVPHMGADMATYGKLISSNIQIENLTPLNNFIHEINNIWLKTTLRPETKYFYGVHDDVVAKTSSVPTDKDAMDVISVDENHTSISKPEGVDSTVFIAVKDLVLNYASCGSKKPHLKQSFSSEENLNNQNIPKIIILNKLNEESLLRSKSRLENLLSQVERITRQYDNETREEEKIRIECLLNSKQIEIEKIKQEINGEMV